jgi:GTP-binding protein Era
MSSPKKPFVVKSAPSRNQAPKTARRPDRQQPKPKETAAAGPRGASSRGPKVQAPKVYEPKAHEPKIREPKVAEQKSVTPEKKDPKLKQKKVKHRAGFVAILGRPNAGKSTLLNAFIGSKVAIVASKPQTTRTSIQGVVTLPEAQIVFIDTPGIHKAQNLLNRRMMEAVRGAAEAPDLVLFVIDSLQPISDEDRHAVDLIKKIDAPVIAVLNKIDWLDNKAKLFDTIEQYRALDDFAAYVPVSARGGEGIDILRQEVIQRLPVGPATYPEDYLTDQPERYMAAEVMREKVLHHARQEVPHAVAVLVESWEDTPKLLRISAVIYVEREGQKAIVIGAAGAGLKKIGTQARMELERLLDRKIFLQLLVKVRANWREDPEFITAIDWRSMLGSDLVEK